MTLKALIFDIDGTMAETEGIHRKAFNLTFREKGMDWHWDDRLYRQLLTVTGGKERMAYYARNFDPDFLSLPGSLERIQDIHTRKGENYVALLQEGKCHPRPGIARLIDEAREQGIKLGIATTTSPVNVTALLSGIFGKEGEGLFDAIVGGDSVRQKKPAPDVYQQVLQQLKCAPEECVAFEDSEIGLTSATIAQVPTIVNLSAYTSCATHEKAKIVVSHLGDPENPCQVIHGSLAGKKFIDIDFCHACTGTPVH